MLPISGYAANPGIPLNLGLHTFEAADDGQLLHYIDGELRATVPPEGMADYAASWPQCADLVSQLTRTGQAADVTSAGVGSSSHLVSAADSTAAA